MYVWIPNSPFVTIGWKFISPYTTYIAKVFRWPSWIVTFPPMGFLGTFSMLFHIIFWTYSDKNRLVTNLFNVYYVVPPNGPGPKTIKKMTNSTPNKSQTQRLVLT